MIERVATIGGGTGTPVSNESLLRTHRVNCVDSVVTVFDDGGETGKRRFNSRGEEIAFSDAMRVMLSLVDPILMGTDRYDALIEHMKSRSWGGVLGQEVFAQFHKNGDGFDEIQKHLTKLTGIEFHGNVIPSTTRSTNIVFSTKHRGPYIGEHELDEHYMSKDKVTKMWLEKKVPAYKPALAAVKNADLIILSCGSMHGSVLCNFLPTGMKKAMRETNAEIYLLTNLVSTKNETDNFKPVDFIKLVKKYTGIYIDGLIIPEMTRKQFESKYRDVALLYDLDYAHFLGWENEDLYHAEDRGVRIITHQAVNVVEVSKNRKILRHDPIRLAEAFKELLASV